MLVLVMMPETSQLILMFLHDTVPASSTWRGKHWALCRNAVLLVTALVVLLAP